METCNLTEISHKVLAKAAIHSAKAYIKGSASPKFSFDVKGIQGYIEEDAIGLWIVFRGTDELSDMISNLKVSTEWVSTGGLVHQGFLDAYRSVSDEIMSIVSNINSLSFKRNLYITGHSLGGALATICASELSSNKPTLITFGSPRVGDEMFANSILGPHFRVVNSGDVVTQIPTFWRFSHSGQEIWFNQKGEMRKPAIATRLKDFFWSVKYNWSRGNSFMAKNHKVSRYVSNCIRLSS